MLLLRYLRKREVESFMESDMVGFQPFRQTHEVSKEPDPLEFLVSNDISEHEVGDNLIRYYSAVKFRIAPFAGNP